MIGPPGSGKTLLAKAFLSILPTMSMEKCLEVTKIYSISGLLPPSQPLITQCPFRSPHHTASSAALIGGGTRPMPGEITLAHCGILFLDELPEFKRDVLESLRQPLEERKICISRVQNRITFPAKFILIAAMNPCPCGYFGDPSKECVCRPGDIIRYRKKISGPLLDRIDIIIEVPRLSFKEISGNVPMESSKEIKQKIIDARKIQEQRFINVNKRYPTISSKARNKVLEQSEGVLISANGEMRIKEINEFCQVEQPAEILLKKAINKYFLSARSYHRILKISRTIADLENTETIKFNHVAEALQYKTEFSWNEY